MNKYGVGVNVKIVEENQAVDKYKKFT